MEIIVKINTTDPASIEFLDRAKPYRKMAAVVADAIAHYCRTPEGQKSMEIIENLGPKKTKKRNIQNSKGLDTHVIAKNNSSMEQIRDLGGMLTFKKTPKE